MTQRTRQSVSDSLPDAPEKNLPDEEPVYLPYQAFPVTALPRSIRRFVSAQAADLNCDEAAVALPTLAALASAIGPQRRIRLKRSWTEPATLWTVVITDHATCSKPPLQAAIDPLKRREWEETDQNRAKWAQYKQDLTRYRSESRRYNGMGLAPVRPEKPNVRQYVTTDCHAKSVIRQLARQERGILVCGEELNGWLERSMSGRNRHQAELATWFDLYDGRPVILPPRSSDSEPVMVPQASASLTGTVLPDVLSQAMKKSKSSGVLERMLMAAPPSRPRLWTDDDIDEQVTRGYADVLKRLNSLSVNEEEEEEQQQQEKIDEAKKVEADLQSMLAQSKQALLGESEHPLLPPELLALHEERRKTRKYGPACDRLRVRPGEVMELSEETLDHDSDTLCTAIEECLDNPELYPPFYQWEELQDVNFVDRFQRLVLGVLGISIVPANRLPPGMLDFSDLFAIGDARLAAGVGRVTVPTPKPLTEPELVTLSPDAKRRFVEYYNESGQAEMDPDHPLAATTRHLESTAARLALVIHLTRWAAGESVDPEICDGASMTQAITLARWFKNEAWRIQTLLGELPEEKAQRELIEWLKRRGGEATARDLCRANGRRYPTIALARAALDQLEEEEKGSWGHEPSRFFGRPARQVFALRTGDVWSMPAIPADCRPKKSRSTESAESESEQEATVGQPGRARATTDEIDVNEPHGSQPGRVQVNPEEEQASRQRR
jgi:hypothetical protein